MKNNMKWYWWLLLFITFPIGWIIAIFIIDDFTNSIHKEWEEEMEEYLKNLDDGQERDNRET